MVLQPTLTSEYICTWKTCKQRRYSSRCYEYRILQEKLMESNLEALDLMESGVKS